MYPIYAYIDPLAPPQLIGIYGSPIEHLGQFVHVYSRHWVGLKTDRATWTGRGPWAPPSQGLLYPGGLHLWLLSRAWCDSKEKA